MAPLSPIGFGKARGQGVHAPLMSPETGLETLLASLALAVHFVLSRG